MSAETAPAVAIATEPAPELEKAQDETPAAPTAPSQPEKVATQPPRDEVRTPLSQFFIELPSIIQEADHKEMWGVELRDALHVPTTIVLEKFLRANAKDVTKAKAQLLEALKWRKKLNPMHLLSSMEFDQTKFGGLGYVTVYPQTKEHGREIVTWNIYGAVKNNTETFGNVEE